MPDLIEMLTYKRPAASKTERKFIRRFIDVLPGIEADQFGNRILQLGTAPVLWSAHTDTVHRTAGKQSVYISHGTAGDDRLVHLPPGSKSRCLGADNTAGVWMLLEMIESQVEGTYVFHRAEEKGGLGSKHIARTNPRLLDGIQMAIAFDRRGYGDIITHQSGMTASDTFAKALAEQIGMGHAPSEWGIFTDTDSYADLVPECTNVSAGFAHEHSSSEWLNIDYLYALRDAMLNVDVHKLPIRRQRGEDDLRWDYGPLGNLSMFGGETDEIHDLVRNYPDIAANLLLQYGVTEDEFLGSVFQNHNHLPRIPHPISDL